MTCYRLRTTEGAFVDEHATRPGAILQRMLVSGTPVVAPGAYDALSARLIASLGYSAVYLGGFATAAPSLQFEPLMTMTEQIGAAATLTRALGPGIPLIVDGHTGFGDPPHITRSVHEFERAGVAAIHLEDQPFPKLPGYQFRDKKMVPAEEMVQRITAAKRASTDLLIFARTEARGLATDLTETIRRMRIYADAGADALIPGVGSLDEAREIRSALPGIPLIWTAGLGRFTPGEEELSNQTLHEIGWECVLVPLAGIVTAIRAVKSAYQQFAETGVIATDGLEDGYDDILKLIEARTYYDIERRYRT
jgi:2-methylisocitrate lyase-like PEP mutase family enzyme